MKAKELAEMLLEYPDFEVRGSYCDTSKITCSHPWPEYVHLDIGGIVDIGHSDKVIILDCEGL